MLQNLNLAFSSRNWLLCLCLSVLVSACTNLSDDPLLPRSAAETPAVFQTSTIPLDYDAVQLTLTRFLNAWKTADYAEMYAYLTPEVQQSLPYTNFRQYYREASRNLTLETIEYQLIALAPRNDETDAAVALYDVFFETFLVGNFTDAGRQMELSRSTNGDWGIDWHPGLIFAEMDDGATLQLLNAPTGRLNIYTRDGIPLADQSGTLIYIDLVPERIPDIENCLDVLNRITESSIEDLRSLIFRSPADWLVDVGTLRPSLYRERRATIEDSLSSACAANLRVQATRRYPNGRLAPHVVGYVGLPSVDELEQFSLQGLDAESIIGRSGVEASWDETLRGTSGGELRIVSASGQLIRSLSSQSPTPAQSVWLTIQSDLQAYVRDLLQQIYENGRVDEGSAGAAAIVMDVHSGAIHALVSHPDYDLNALTVNPDLAPEPLATAIAELSDPRRPELNRVTQGVYPAGSIFKPVTFIAALDSELYDLDRAYFCNGSWSRPQEGFVRTDWYPDGHGWVNTYTAIPQSCNPYFYESGFDLNQADPFRLPTYARRLGLGEKTGIHAIDESAGAIEDPQTVRRKQGYVWTFSDAVSMAIGQGFVSITPLQIARMYAAFANGGTLLHPQLVWQSGLPGDEPTHRMEPSIQAEINIQPEVLDRLHHALCDIADVWYGTALHAFRDSPLLSRGVCGKTGTAQDLRPGGDFLPHAWFVAYAPADDPEIVVLVMVENSGEGSVVAAPLVRNILEYYFYRRNP
ncbi:MAG: penicillin-binding transpeptidase domain-containing protein [Anaerolineaceae bacterium]|nr:penicillin-binding transpeptidase domain-containing protein [Anaerolineaceae bacterium]